MKYLITVTLWLVCLFADAQGNVSTKTNIDDEVQRIQKDSLLKPIIFTIQAMKKVLHYIKYTYTENTTGYIRITREFSRKDELIRQAFYLKKNQLIFAREEIVTFYSDNSHRDSVMWGGQFYFSEGKLIHHITLGHGKSELDSWDPEQDMLNAFKESKQDIVRFKTEKKGS